MPTADEPTEALPNPGCVALLVFGSAWLVLFLVVAIGASYGSDDPLLAMYGLLLLVGVAVAWRGLARRQELAHAIAFFVAVAAALWLGSTFG